MKNWKTSLFGLLSAVGSVLTTSPKPVIQTIGQILTPLSLLLLGKHASDASNSTN